MTDKRIGFWLEVKEWVYLQTLKKNLKSFHTKYVPDAKIYTKIYHKGNLFITAVVDGSIFVKYLRLYMREKW